MITLEQYFQAKPHSAEQEATADDLLTRVNTLLQDSVDAGVQPHVCPNTGTEISGSKHGQGDGGFRLPTATTGAASSSHKEAKAVDVFDPTGALDEWITDGMLEQFGLYREHPDATPGWCHLTTRAPHSGLRTFRP